MFKSRLYLHSLFIIFFLPSILSAQKVGLPEIEHFNRRQYGGGTQNWKITQDEHDLMYFANNDGILVYDGVNWDLLTDNAPEVIRSVEAIDHRIYTCSYNEFGYYAQDSLNHLKYNSMMDIDDVEPSGNYWNTHRWGNKLVFHSESNITILENDNFVCSIPSNSRFTSSYLVNDLLLVHDEKLGLMQVRGTKIYPVSGGNVFSDKLITSILRISDSKIVIGTMKNGLYLWDMHTINPWNVPANAILKENNIFCSTPYLDDFLIYGSIQAGLIILDKKGNIVMHIDKDKGLHNNTVLSVFVDREGSIWAGLDNGIVRVSYNAGLTYLQGYYNIGTGYTIIVDGEDYYMGTNQALYIINKEKLYDPLKTRDDFVKVKGTDGQVWSLLKANNGIICGHNLGAYSIVDGEAKLITPTDVNGIWTFRTIKGYPELLLAGTYNGLVLFEYVNGDWAFKSKIKGFNESARFMEWDENGNLWVSHGYEGVFRLRFDSEYGEVVSLETIGNDAFKVNSAGLVLCRLNDFCVFTGEEGIFKIDKETNLPTPYPLLDAYFEKGHFPKMITEDAFSNIWFFFQGEVGVLRYMEDGTYKKIDHPFKSMKDKFVNSFEFVLGSDEDNALFGVEDGFAHYSVHDQKNYREPFRVNIRSFKGKGDSLAYVLNQDDVGLSEQDVIPKYAFRNNAFEINFAAPYYEDDRIEYSTMLRGEEKETHAWDTKTTRHFSKLWEGEYEFVVKARNRYGVQSKALTFKFEVLPPWHRTMLAKLVYIIAFLFSTFLLLRIINKRIDVSRRKEIIKQRAHYHDKEQALKNEALNAEKEMIRMRNEKLRNEMVHKEKELANSTMSIIKKNEFLTSIKGQLKKLKQIEDKTELTNKVQSLIRKIDKDIDSESYWEIFELHLDQVHESFLLRLAEEHPELSPREKKLCAYIRMGMTSKEIASLMNISSRAVENNRYRLRQKLNLNHGDNLSLYITNM
ncbi:LuxR C-terminal-related transcriptional regulator [Carboxylicivirga sp. N1Y90]|uniref:LuxR C-terminal-related transcriptional regulator n=1 Tax=Carboxylicivirga fragile TaxID=3417571 RepID=UPI003D33E8BB|nr:regulator [Marinilabiliaceae bacterium N1Y90]